MLPDAPWARRSARASPRGSRDVAVTRKDGTCAHNGYVDRAMKSMWSRLTPSQGEYADQDLLVRRLSPAPALCRRTQARAQGPRSASTINRWIIPYSPNWRRRSTRHQRPVWLSWCMDETDVTVTGPWYDLSRAVDQHGQTMAFLRTGYWDARAATRFLTKAICCHGVPETLTINGRVANEAGSRAITKRTGLPSPSARSTISSLRGTRLSDCEARPVSHAGVHVV